MSNLYKEIDDYIDLLEKNSQKVFASKIRNAERGGSMAPEILGMVSVELKEYPKYLGDKDASLKLVAVSLLDKINVWFKQY